MTNKTTSKKTTSKKSNVNNKEDKTMTKKTQTKKTQTTEPTVNKKAQNAEKKSNAMLDLKTVSDNLHTQFPELDIRAAGDIYRPYLNGDRIAKITATRKGFKVYTPDTYLSEADRPEAYSYLTKCNIIGFIVPTAAELAEYLTAIVRGKQDYDTAEALKKEAEKAEKKAKKETEKKAKKDSKKDEKAA